MAIRQKWDINGKGKGAATGEGNRYNGPDLPKGSWPAKIKRMTIGAIGENKKPGAQRGDNDGKPRISVLLEVTGLTGDKAKYNGHPIWDGLNIIESSVPFVNAFLHGLTDGSERAKRAVEAAFWDEDKGPITKRVKVEKGPRAGKVDKHIIKIGKYEINSPKGETIVQVTTRAGTVDFGPNKGDYKCEITGYIPGEATKSKADDDDLDEDDDDLLDSDVDDDDLDDGDEDSDDGDDDADDEDYADEDEDEEDDEDDDLDEDDDEEEDEPVSAGRGDKPF